MRQQKLHTADAWNFHVSVNGFSRYSALIGLHCYLQKEEIPGNETRHTFPLFESLQYP